MSLPPLPEAVHIRRNAHGFTHSFSHLQMDAYGRECAAEATKQLTHEHDALKDAAKLALDALELHAKHYPHMQKGYTVDAIAALKAVL